MNGIGTLLLIAIVGQAGAAPVATDKFEKDFGWQVNRDDGVLEYIVQVAPDQIEMLTKYGQEKSSAMPPELVGRVARIVVRIGSTVLPRTPTLQEIERKFPIIGSSNSNANFPVTPPGYSANNMKTVEPPAVHSVAGNSPPTLPSSRGSSTMPDRESSLDAGQKSSAPSGLPSIPSLTSPDPSLLAQNGSDANKFLNSARDSQQVPARAPAAASSSDKFNSLPKQTPNQPPSSRSSTGAGGSLADVLQRDFPAAQPQAAGNLASPLGAPAQGSLGLPGAGGFANQANASGQYTGTNTGNSRTTLPNYQPPMDSSQPTATDRWASGGQVTLPSQQYGLPGTQPIPQSPVAGFGNTPMVPAAQGYVPNNYGGSNYNLGQASAYQQPPGNQDPYLSPAQATYSGNGHPSAVRQPQYDPRIAERMYEDRIAMNAASQSREIPSTSMTRSGENVNGQWVDSSAGTRRGSDIDATLTGNRSEPVKTSDKILQVFFLLSLVVNFYLGLLIRKLLARYRSLLTSVRSQTA